MNFFIGFRGIGLCESEQRRHRRRGLVVDIVFQKQRSLVIVCPQTERTRCTTRKLLGTSLPDENQTVVTAELNRHFRGLKRLTQSDNQQNP